MCACMVPNEHMACWSHLQAWPPYCGHQCSKIRRARHRPEAPANWGNNPLEWRPDASYEDCLVFATGRHSMHDSSMHYAWS